MMTPDPVQQNANWASLRDTLESKGFTPAEVERERQNWFTHDAKRIVKENSFIFKLESVGVYSNRELIQKACDIITEKLETVQKLAEQRVMEIITSKTTMSNCYDIILKNYDYTIGKILEYIIYTDYFKTNRRINFAGFIKEHPHDEFSIIRISFINQIDAKNEINDIIQYSCQVAKRIFKHIRDF
jgi:DNA-directed RNA polymerase subunit L